MCDDTTLAMVKSLNISPDNTDRSTVWLLNIVYEVFIEYQA